MKQNQRKNIYGKLFYELNLNSQKQNICLADWEESSFRDPN